MTNKKRKPRICGDIALVPLTKGYEAIIDVKDADFVAQWNWHAEIRRHTIYAKRTGLVGEPSRHIYLHRALGAAPVGLNVDHVDGDGLNNRRTNLRIATPSQNSRNRRLCVNNSSGLKGVSWHSQRKKWRASIKHHGESIHLGLFQDRLQAHQAYIDASAKIHGRFGRAQ